MSVMVTLLGCFVYVMGLLGARSRERSLKNAGISGSTFQKLKSNPKVLFRKFSLSLLAMISVLVFYVNFFSDFRCTPESILWVREKPQLALDTWSYGCGQTEDLKPTACRLFFIKSFDANAFIRIEFFSWSSVEGLWFKVFAQSPMRKISIQVDDGDIYEIFCEEVKLGRTYCDFSTETTNLVVSAFSNGSRAHFEIDFNLSGPVEFDIPLKDFSALRGQLKSYMQDQ